MICRKCRGPTTVYRTYGSKVVTRERRCERCGEQWETHERDTPGTRVCYRDAICSAPVAHRQQVGASGSDLISSLSSRRDPDQTPARVSEPIAPAENEVFSFPVVGGATWSHGDRLHVEYQAAFPHLDLHAEYAKARAWLVANPSKKKTPRGMPKFLFAWLERAQNAGRAAAKPADPRCYFHRTFPNVSRKHPPGRSYTEGCPDCKHLKAANGTRQSEPAPLRSIIPATREEIERAKTEVANG